jgi:hypothetical protein
MRMDETKGSLEIVSWAFHSPRIRVRLQRSRVTCGFSEAALPAVLAKPRYLRLQRSRVTCGFIKTALPDVWPILGIVAKPRTNWIHADVVGFFDSGLQIS